MKLDLKDYYNITKASDEILDALIVELEEYKDAEIEDLEFKIEDGSYALIVNEEEEWISGGKYEYGGSSYQLVRYDSSIASYPTKKSIIYYYDIFVKQSIYRSGSYFSDWYYTYEEPAIYKVYIKKVSEVIIPEHEEIKFKNI